jgi:hypothetical protein
MIEPVSLFREHSSKVREYASLNLSESDTRAYLIDPILRILGYEGLDDLHREVSIPATKEHIDYELLIGGQATVVVEAKAIRHSITDQHAAQCVQYASVLGVRWCLITNGLTWVVYDAYAKGPLADKRVAQVGVGENETADAEAWAVLSLFSKQALSRAEPLTRLLTERVVRDELQDPGSPAITALRNAVRSRFGERVSTQAVVDAAVRLMAPDRARALGVERGSTSETAGPSDGLGGGQDESKSTRRRGSSGRLMALVHAGLLPEDGILETRIKGVSYVGRLRGGQIEVEGKLYSSPSAAAGALRGGMATNGWVWWLYKGATLAELRRRLREQQASSDGPK